MGRLVIALPLVATLGVMRFPIIPPQVNGAIAPSYIPYPTTIATPIFDNPLHHHQHPPKPPPQKPPKPAPSNTSTTSTQKRHHSHFPQVVASKINQKPTQPSRDHPTSPQNPIPNQAIHHLRNLIVRTMPRLNITLHHTRIKLTKLRPPIATPHPRITLTPNR